MSQKYAKSFIQRILGHPCFRKRLRLWTKIVSTQRLIEGTANKYWNRLTYCLVPDMPQNEHFFPWPRLESAAGLPCLAFRLRPLRFPRVRFSVPRSCSNFRRLNCIEAASSFCFSRSNCALVFSSPLASPDFCETSCLLPSWLESVEAGLCCSLFDNSSKKTSHL